MKKESFLLVLNTKNPQYELTCWKDFLDKTSELPKINAILFSIISLGSTVHYIHLKSALVA
jgi:hypothetical protein